MARSGQVAWVETNVGGAKDARALVLSVLARRLAACANTWPIESSYWWKGGLVREGEIAVVFKTDPRVLDALIAAVREAHPYEVPYLAWGEGERALPAYARWIRQEAKPPRSRKASSRAGTRQTR